MLSWLRCSARFVDPFSQIITAGSLNPVPLGASFFSTKKETVDPQVKLEKQRALHPKKRKKYGAVGRGERRLERIDRRQALREERRLYRAEKRFEAEADDYRRAALLNKYKCLVQAPVNFPSAFSLDPTTLPSWHHLSKTRRRQALQTSRLRQNQSSDDEQNEERAEDAFEANEHMPTSSGASFTRELGGSGELALIETGTEQDVGNEEEGEEEGEAGEEYDELVFQGPSSKAIGSANPDRQGPSREYFANMSLELDSRRVYLIDPCLSEEGTMLPKALRKVVFDETHKLVEAVGWSTVRSEQINLRRAHPKWFFGSGKAGEIAETVQSLLPDSPLPLVVVVNGMLSGGTLNRLEKKFGGLVTVLDRMGLILEIFKRRARHRESKLLVELATNEYERARLVGAREGLDRQRGGGRSMSGAGETKYETDRRALDLRLDWLNKQLSSIEKRRSAQRLDRKRKFPVVALVGYTNVGKSALLNRLTGSEAFSEDLLFASLDTYTRPLRFASGQMAILVDTIGFISNMPDSLLPAFRATLEEVRHANLIVHVRDASNPFHDWQAEQVEGLLASLDIGGVPTLNIYNKIDGWEAWKEHSRLVEDDEEEDDNEGNEEDETIDNEGRADKEVEKEGRDDDDDDWDNWDPDEDPEGDDWQKWDGDNQEEGEESEGGDQDDDDDFEREERDSGRGSLVKKSSSTVEEDEGDNSDADWDDWDPDEGFEETRQPWENLPEGTTLPELDDTLLRVSATSGDGCGTLVNTIEERLQNDFLYISCDVEVSVFHQHLLTFCHRSGKVRHKEFDHERDIWKIRLLFLPGVFAKFNKMADHQQYIDRLQAQMDEQVRRVQ